MVHIDAASARDRARVVAVGAGALTREVAEVVAARRMAGLAGGSELVGLVVDDADPDQQAGTLERYRLLGGLDALPQLLAADPTVGVVVCLANPRRPQLRLEVATALGLAPDAYLTLTHPHVSVARSTGIGPGSVLMAGVVTTADVQIGAHVLVMPGTVLTHDDTLEDGVTVAAGVRLAGGVTVGTGAYLGAGALVREELRVGEGAIVGMGAVVVRDVPAGEVWAGNPARRMGTVG